MEIDYPVTAAADLTGSPIISPIRSRDHARWLLELDTDGIIRHSGPHPAVTFAAADDDLVGSNFFDLAPVLGDLSDLRRNFIGFVNSRKASSLKTIADISSGKAVVVLTRSYDTAWPTRREVVLMEIRS